MSQRVESSQHDVFLPVIPGHKTANPAAVMELIKRSGPGASCHPASAGRVVFLD